MERAPGSVVRVVLAVASLALALPAAAQVTVPTVTAVTLIDGTSDMQFPGTGVANLDAGDLVAGNTKWDPFGAGIVFNDTRVGFFWEPLHGSTVFRVNGPIYFEPNFVFPQAISSSRAVVGGDVLREQRRVLPFLWTPEEGFTYLPTPCSSPRDALGSVPLGACSGSASAISADASISVGTLFDTVTSPGQAVRWIAKSTRRGLRLTVDRLSPKAPWSHAFDLSEDGRTVVGDAGATADAVAAAKWVDGSPSPLDPVGSSSTALHEAVDGSASIGWATDEGRQVLVRWTADGAATAFAPPVGTTIVAIHAINPSATAAAGTLARGDDWAPFLWSLDGGFTILPELDEPAYDRSEALDVSDDGTVVVGALQAGVVSNGFPRSYGFLWSERTGLVLVDDLLVAHGQADADYYRAFAISGDGRRIVASGNPPASLHDTNSILVELAPY